MNKPTVPSRLSINCLLLVVAFAIFAATNYIGYNNSFRSLPLFFFLTIVGISLMLAFGFMRGGAGALVVVSLWIGLKRSMGVWQDVFLWNNILELGLLMALFAICGAYSERLRIILDAYFNSVARLELLNMEDSRTGLIKAAIGKLRLQEEEERSVRYRRPFSLLLIQVQSNSLRDSDPDHEAILMRMVANTVKGTTRRTDIPFLAASDQVALIFPETDDKGAARMLSNVRNRMLEVRFMNDQGTESMLEEHIQLRFGIATFTGLSSEKIDMFKAAEDSLLKALEKDSHDIFQNSVVEWVLIGDHQPGSLPENFNVVADIIPITEQKISEPAESVNRFKQLLKSSTTPRKSQVPYLGNLKNVDNSQNEVEAP